MKKIVLAAAMVALSSGSAYAASTSGSASAIVVSPISVSHNAGASLNFGSFTAGTGGTVAVTSGGSGSVTGGAGGVTFVSGYVNSADAFTVNGDGSRGFTISTASGSVNDGFGNSMPFTTTPSAATGTLSGGTASFTVGGTLTVGSGQTANPYSGSYLATVNYQ